MTQINQGYYRVIELPTLFPSGRVAEEKTRYTSVATVIMHPVSRGHVHIQSSNPNDRPNVDAAYFKSPADLETAKNGIEYIFKLTETDAFKRLVLENVTKNEIESDKDSKDPLGDYCKRFLSTSFHYVGTASMLPKEKDGVVDPNLKVYGTSNLRVVSSTPRW